MYSNTIQSKFNINLMIFSEKRIYEKIVWYTGTLTGGSTGLAPLIKIVGLLILIHMPFNGFPQKSIVLEILEIINFRLRNGQILPTPSKGG